MYSLTLSLKNDIVQVALRARQLRRAEMSVHAHVLRRALGSAKKLSFTCHVRLKHGLGPLANLFDDRTPLRR